MSNDEYEILELPTGDKLVFENAGFPSHIPMEMLSYEQSASPFVNVNSAQRITIAAAQKSHSVNLIAPERFRIRTGLEQQTADYLLENGYVPEDGIVLTCIPRFNFAIPYKDLTGGFLVIYETSDRVVSYIDLPDYVALTSGFGFMCHRPTNQIALRTGDSLKAGTRLRASPAIDEDGIWVDGLSVNFCTLTLPMVEQDAFIMTESLYQRTMRHGFEVTDINISSGEFGLNLYGDKDTAKFFPDIGETIRPDGILMTLRTITSENVIGAMGNPTTPLELDDRIIKITPRSTVVDVEVYYAGSAINGRIKSQGGTMDQLSKYHDSYMAFVDAIDKFCATNVNKGVRYSPEMNDLITRAKIYKYAYYNKGKIPVKYKDDIVSNIYLRITTRYTECLGIGCKMAGPSGDKNVCGMVVPDDWAPVNALGVRADFIMAVNSVTNRMNLEQLYIQFLNALSNQIVLRARSGEFGAGKKLYTKLLEFTNDICWSQTPFIEQILTNDEKRMMWVDEILRDGFYHHVGQAHKDMTVEHIQFLREKYNYVKTPVKFSYLVDGVKKDWQTTCDVTIGEKHLYVLGKLPSKQITASETAHVNQFGLPIKTRSKEAKQSHLRPPTPIQFGFDEIGLLANVLSTEDLMRLVLQAAGSPEATRTLCEELATVEHPSALEYSALSNEQIMQMSESIRAFVDVWSEAGYDLMGLIAQTKGENKNA